MLEPISISLKGCICAWAFLFIPANVSIGLVCNEALLGVNSDSDMAMKRRHESHKLATNDTLLLQGNRECDTKPYEMLALMLAK